MTSSEDGDAAGQRPLSAVPDALEVWDQLVGVLADRRPVLFLDFDGTLAPIVDDPADAAIPASMVPVLDDLAAAAPVAVVSGRDLRDVRERVPVTGVWFAGSHGFEITGPGGQHHQHPAAEGALGGLDDAERTCRRRLAGIQGVTVERKRYAIAVHYRRIRDDARIDEVVGAVEDVGRSTGLRVTGGRKVVELRPDIDWHKGKALEWLLEAMVPDRAAVLPVYAGDDLTDEDALATVHATGLGVVVRSEEHGDRPTHAHIAVADVDALAELLARVAHELRR